MAPISPFAATALVAVLAGSVPLVSGATQSPASYSGTLVRRDSTPVVSARVRLSGVERVALTSDSGRFEFRDLLPGRYDVSILAPGSPPVSMQVVLAPGESYHTRIVLAEEPQRLQDITVSTAGARPSATERRLEGFERRRRRGLGVFLTAADLARRNPRVLSDALVNINGTRLMDRGRGKVLISARGMIPTAYGGGMVAAPCMLRVVIDGMSLPTGLSVDEVKPEDIAGIEIYPGSASMPVELAHFQEDSWCGAVVIWTRGG
ncbi:MAG TPA: carboxypeptidase regulatory-like domain-containing protein [Gemmatimonadales bacterium]